MIIGRCEGATHRADFGPKIVLLQLNILTAGQKRTPEAMVRFLVSAGDSVAGGPVTKGNRVGLRGLARVLQVLTDDARNTNGRADPQPVRIVNSVLVRFVDVAIASGRAQKTLGNS